MTDVELYDLIAKLERRVEKLERPTQDRLAYIEQFQARLRDGQCVCESCFPRRPEA